MLQNSLADGLDFAPGTAPNICATSKAQASIVTSQIGISSVIDGASAARI